MNASAAWLAKRSVIASLMLFPAYVLAQQDAPPPAHAEVRIKPIGSNSVSGTLTLEQTGQSSVAVKGTLHGLTPGKHGLHIHEGRSCNSRGGHFSPVNAPHGAPDSGEDKHHLGDLGNVVAGQDGTANYSGVANVTLTGANNIDGRVLVVHQGEDDLVSQPSGKSGEQIGCGVINIMPQ